jgi:O-antigen/teichoic acid export membrane protein
MNNPLGETHPAGSGMTGSLLGPRGRTILHTGAWSLVAKTCAAANLFISVPFVLHALGPVQFGAWATLISFVTFAGFLDFGFGNGVMNLIAAAKGRGANDEISVILREGTHALLRIALCLGAAAVLAVLLVPWSRLLGLPASLSGTSRIAALAVLATIVLAIPLNLTTRVQLGLGRGNRAFRWQALGQLLALALVIACARAGASLSILTAAAVATPLLATLANTLELRRSQRKTNAWPTPARDLAIAQRIRREGLLFFVLQLSAALAFSADLPLISALRGPADAGTYAIVQRLFSVIPLALSLLWVPLWPAYRQALANQDHRWVERTLRRSIIVAITLASVAATTLCVGFDRIIAFWVHRPLLVSFILLSGFAVWVVMDAAGTAIATFLNAASVVRYQVVVASIFGITCIMAKAWAILHFGVAFIPWVTVVSYLVIFMAPTAILLPGIVRRTFARQY